MDKAIETPVTRAEGVGVLSGEVAASATTPAEASPTAASANETDHPGAEEGTEGGRAKAASRRPRRRPRRTRQKAESDGAGELSVIEDGAEAAPAESETGEPAAAVSVPPEESTAPSTVEAISAAPGQSPDGAPEAAAGKALDAAEAESADAVSGDATSGERGSRRRRRSGGGRKKAAPAAEVAAEVVTANGASAPPAPAQTPVPVVAEPEPTLAVALPDREAAEPISAGRPEIEIEPPTLPEPPVEESAPAPVATADLPAPKPELLEAVPPDLPEPPARERSRRRRGRGDRATAKERAAARAAAAPPVEEPTPAVAEVEVVAEPIEAPAPAEPRDGARGREGERTRGRGGEGKEPRDRGEAREPRDRGEAREPRDRDAGRAEKLAKEIIVNVDARETRIAVIENNRLVELHVEREERVVGSIYKGRVANVLPGMDAAFVDIGLERNAFLYVGDILYESGEENGHGTVYRRAGREVKIRDVAKTGQEILVQVVKGPRGTKGARVSTRMSLPGRYIVLMPEADNLGVSRKIEDPNERERLKKIGDVVRPAGFGMIIRTEAEGKTERDLRQDAELLVQLWRQIQDKARRQPPPSLVHQDLSLLLKTIRDVFGSDVDRMLVDSPSDHQKALELLDILSPELKSRVELYTGVEPIFHRFGLDDEIERLLRRKVWLKSGGYIAIDSTEALTAIDVNTGKFIGSTSLSDTILKTNLDAVQEITRQFRLRDLGGMIIIDFIDMNSAKDRAQVMAALERALKKDRTRTKIAHISPLGLVEMTRKRTGETVTELLTQTCPYCQGRGRVSSPESVSIQIERLIKRRCSETDVDAILVHASPEVAACLIGPEGENVELLEKEVRRPVYVRARHDFHVEKYDILPADMMELEQQILPYRGGQVVECLVQKMDLITAPRSAAWVDGYFVDLANGTRFQGQKLRVRLTDVRRSFALGEPVSPAHALDRSEPI